MKLTGLAGLSDLSSKQCLFLHFQIHYKEVTKVEGHFGSVSVMDRFECIHGQRSELKITTSWLREPTDAKGHECEDNPSTDAGLTPLHSDNNCKRDLELSGNVSVHVWHYSIVGYQPHKKPDPLRCFSTPYQFPDLVSVRVSVCLNQSQCWFNCKIIMTWEARTNWSVLSSPRRKENEAIASRE